MLLVVLRMLRLPGRLQWWAVIASMLIYVPLTGPAPSAVRAGLGASSYALARLLGARPRGWTVLLGVGAFLCVFDPRAPNEVSLWLSFSAVAGIFLLSPVFERWLIGPQIAAHPVLAMRRAPLRRMLCISLAAWLATLPWVALYMGRVAWIGPWVSIVTLPLTAVLLTLALLIAALADVGPLVPVLATLFEGAYSLLVQTMRAVRDVGLGACAIAPPSPGWLLCYAVVLLLLPITPFRRRLWSLALLGLLLGILVLQPFASGDRTVVSSGAAPYTESLGGEPPRQKESFISLHAPIESLGTLALYAAPLAVLAVASCLWKSWLTRGGGAWAFVLGLATLWRMGIAGFAVLLLAFLVGTLLSRLPDNPQRGRRPRSWKQVVANGAAPAIGCGLHAWGYSHIGLPFFLGGVAFLAADTSATEIGTRFGGTPRHILSLKRLKVGRSGGITPAGTVAAAFFALLIPCVWAGITGPIAASKIGAVAGAGLAGALVDSVLGGTLQFLGRHPDTGEIVESRAGERIRGMRWIDNDAVNLLAGVAAGILAVGLFP